MRPNQLFFNQLRLFTLVTIVLLFTFNVFTFQGRATPSMSYFYKFTVDDEGFTNVEVIISSTDTSGSSWVVVPRFSSWNYIVTSGSIRQSANVSTADVGLEDLYFYQAFTFSWSTSSLSMKLQFDFDSGALIIDDRGIFFSPQIGFKQGSFTSGRAEVLFDSHFTVDGNKAIATGSQSYPPTEIDLHRVLFDLPKNEDLLRLQVEFTTSLPTQSTTLTSKNQVFTFESPSLYVDDASAILNLYDTLYNNYTRLFNVTLTPPIGVQFFLPDFDEFLSVGGFVPFSETGAGKINVNIFFTRAVNGTIELIAAHELVHHFLIESGISPNDFLWFHEGMAQYLSVTWVEKLGYEGAKEEKDNLEQSASELIELLRGENFGFLQDWSPSFSPTNVGNYYAASYYIVNSLAQEYGGIDFYIRFFELIRDVDVDNIDTFAEYLSKAADADVALTLYGWGFNVVISPEIREKIIETQRTVAAVNPVFQPYKSLAEFLYELALLSFRQGDTEIGINLLELAIITANLAPLLTLLTIAVIIGIIIYALQWRRKKIKLKPTVTPPPPPPEILGKSAE